MRIVLSDGSGLTARQVARRLGTAGHRVEALAADPLARTRFTRHVHTLHRVPRYSDDPLAWFDAVLRVLDTTAFAGPVDVLIPTQEQVAVLALCGDKIRERAIAVAVPSFDILARVQDKVSATRTLTEIGVPQPDTIVAQNRHELSRCDHLPAYVKPPIGTATTGIVHVRSREELTTFAAGLDDDVFGLGGLVVQRAIDGPLAMVQCVFDGGRLVAWHANLRVREGSGGGASAKRSIELPEARAHCQRLGAVLGWHGALSLDVILPGGVTCDALVIDVNPRLVEPANAWHAGTDLVGALLEVSLGYHPQLQAPGREGVGTHQLLLAALHAASTGRRAVITELIDAIRHVGAYRDSIEELTPVAGDWLAVLPVVAAIGAGLVGRRAARAMSEGAVRSYALTPEGRRRLLRARARGCGKSLMAG